MPALDRSSGANSVSEKLTSSSSSLERSLDKLSVQDHNRRPATGFAAIPGPPRSSKGERVATYGRYPDGPPDVRRECDTHLVRHYSWEVMKVETNTNTANASPRTSRTNTARSSDERGSTGNSVQRGTSSGAGRDSILTPLMEKEGRLLTGKKSKVECLRSAGIERMVGMEVQVWLFAMGT